MSNSTYSAAELEEEAKKKIKSSTTLAMEYQKSDKILQEYAKETESKIRSNSDLSRLEIWLLAKLAELK